MKTKTIKRIIKEKISDWIGSIDDLSLREAIQSDIIVTGGCIASMLLSEDVNDFDIYFKTKENAIIVAKYYLRKMNNPANGGNIKIIDIEDGIKIFIKNAGILKKDHAVNEKGELVPYSPLFVTSNAITLSNKIQIVVRFVGEPKKIHSNYDFVHCTNYYDSESDELVLDSKALEALLTKTLTYIGSKYPICSIIRTKKFLKRKFTINAGQYLKMCYQVSKLDLDDIEVLKDQLIGVDSAYFNALIRALESQTGKSDFKITYPYICTLIDKIFD